MSIELTATTPEPSLDFKHIYLKSLEIRQDYTYLTSDSPLYNLIIFYQLYAISSGEKIFKPDIYELSLEDYQKIAAEKVVAGDPDLMNALLAIEAALAAILVAQGIDAEVV